MNKFEEFIKRYKVDFRLLREIDKGLLFSTIVLILFGIINIYLATKGTVDGLSPFHYARKQLLWFAISMVALYIFVVIDYKVVYRYAPLIYWITVISLITVLVLDVEVNGAKGWINLGFMQIQPAELAKFSIIIQVSKLLDEMEWEINKPKNLAKIVIYVAIPLILILKQPDMGMALVCFFIVLGMLFISGLDKRIIIGGVAIAVMSVFLLWNTNIIRPHQKTRLLEFFSQEKEDSTQGYQLNQSLIGIGSGGITGKIQSFSPEVAPGYAGTHVPEIQTDFIFSAVGEHFGLVGAIFLLGLYAIQTSRMIVIAKRTEDRFGSLICVGITSYFIFAVTQNIGMTIGIMPITGITLPLVSYGGSSLLTTIVAVSLVLNVGMRKRKIRF